MDIYAEITKKQLAAIEDGRLEIAVPPGVIFSRRPNSRACFFECDGQYSFDAVVEFLDAVGISWQEN